MKYASNEHLSMILAQENIPKHNMTVPVKVHGKAQGLMFLPFFWNKEAGK
jgi:hypothetical protein